MNASTSSPTRHEAKSGFCRKQKQQISPVSRAKISPVSRQCSILVIVCTSGHQTIRASVPMSERASDFDANGVRCKDLQPPCSTILDGSLRWHVAGPRTVSAQSPVRRLVGRRGSSIGSCTTVYTMYTQPVYSIRLQLDLSP